RGPGLRGRSSRCAMPTWRSRARAPPRRCSSRRCFSSPAADPGLLGLEPAHAVGQTRDAPGGVVAMQHALRHCFVERARGTSECLLGRGCILGVHRGAYGADESAQLGLDGVIATAPTLALTVALERRGVV